MSRFGEPSVYKFLLKKDVNGLRKALNFKKSGVGGRDAAEALGEIGDLQPRWMKSRIWVS